MLWQKIIGCSSITNQFFSYVTEIQADTFSSTGTINNVSLGVIDTNRKIILAFSWSDSGTATITSVSIGGIAATKAVNSVAGAAFRNDEIWIANVPSGVTGTIVIVRSGGISGSIHGAVFRAVGASIVLHNTAFSYLDGTGINTARSVNLSVPSNGFSVAVYGHGGADVGNIITSWTNMTKYTQDISGGSVSKSAAGSIENSAGTKTINVTSSDTLGNRPGLAAASWSF